MNVIERVQPQSIPFLRFLSMTGISTGRQVADIFPLNSQRSHISREIYKNRLLFVESSTASHPKLVVTFSRPTSSSHHHVVPPRHYCHRFCCLCCPRRTCRTDCPASRRQHQHCDQNLWGRQQRALTDHHKYKVSSGQNFSSG